MHIPIEALKEIEEANASQEWKVYQSAIVYIEAGLYVIPIRPGGKETPPASTGINIQSASKTRNVVIKWFDPDNGRFAGWNIGIAGGRKDGVFIVDVDKKEDKRGKNGFTTLDEYKVDGDELPECPRASTPGGGNHYFFLWQENAHSTTNKIGPGVDTRGGDEIRHQGHVVAFPSIVNERMYTWERGGDIPEVPRWIIKALGVPWKSKKRSEDSSFENEPKVPIEQIERMLKYVKAEDLGYDDWLAIGMSIHSQHPTDEGCAAWDMWSREDEERYEKGGTRIRWYKFDSDGPIRIATLQMFATKGGWVPQKDDVMCHAWEEEVAEMNLHHAIVNVNGKIRILREKRIIDDPMLKPYHLMDKDAFKSLYANQKLVTHVRDRKGELKTAIQSKADVWLAHPSRRTYHEGLGFFPSGAPEGYYNTWRGFHIQPRKGSYDSWSEHIRKVICRDQEDWYEWVFDWMADCVQDPGNPKGCAIVVRGKEGTGKGTFADQFGRLFGSHYRHLIDESHLLSNFNSHILEAVVVFADEVVWGGNRKSAGNLKGLVTEKYVAMERKGIDVEQVRNCIHLIMASNEDWVVPAGPHSRRWFVLESTDDHRNDREYFRKIYHQMDNGGAEALLWDLKHREIESNLTRAPETPFIVEQRTRHLSGKAEVEWWMHNIMSGFITVHPMDNIDEAAFSKNAAWPESIDKKAAYDAFEDWCRIRNLHIPSPGILYGHLKKLGLEEFRATTGERRRKFRVPGRTRARELFIKATGIDPLMGESNEESDTDM